MIIYYKEFTYVFRGFLVCSADRIWTAFCISCFLEHLESDSGRASRIKNIEVLPLSGWDGGQNRTLFELCVSYTQWCDCPVMNQQNAGWCVCLRDRERECACVCAITRAAGRCFLVFLTSQYWHNEALTAPRRHPAGKLGGFIKQIGPLL